MLGLANYRESLIFTERERLVIDLAVEMARTPVDVPDALTAALAAEFTESQLVELTAAIAWENYRARFNRVFHVEAAGYSDGAFCLLPEAPPNAVARDVPPADT